MPALSLLGAACLALSERHALSPPELSEPLISGSGMQEAAVHALTTPQRVPAKSSPSPYVSPGRTAFKRGKWGELATGAGVGWWLHCFFAEGLAAPSSLGTTAQSLARAYPRALLSELHQQVSDSTLAAVGADGESAGLQGHIPGASLDHKYGGWGVRGRERPAEIPPR